MTINRIINYICDHKKQFNKRQNFTMKMHRHNYMKSFTTGNAAQISESSAANSQSTLETSIVRAEAQEAEARRAAKKEERKKERVNKKKKASADGPARIFTKVEHSPFDLREEADRPSIRHCDPPGARLDAAVGRSVRQFEPKGNTAQQPREFEPRPLVQPREFEPRDRADRFSNIRT